MRRITDLKPKITAAATVAVMLLPSLGAQAANMPEKTIVYVSPNGSDSAKGTKDSPFKTPERARDYLREVKNSEGLAKDGAVVYFREGDYTITESFELDERDSGTETQPIVYRAYPDEEVRFLGGVSVDESMFTQLSDSDIIERIGNANVSKKVLQANLHDLGVEEVPPIHLVGSYSYSVPEFLEYNGYVSTRPDPGIEIFVNEQALTLARYPNEGTLMTETIKEPGTEGMYWREEAKYKSAWVPPEERSPDKIVLPVFSPDDKSHLAKWTNTKDALVYGKLGFLWADESTALKSVDTEAKTMTLAWPVGYTAKADMPFYVYNLPEEIDVPGEYYIDRETDMIYLYPPEHKGKMDITLSLLTDPIINLENTEYVTIKDLYIGMTRGMALTINGGTHNTVDSCEISFTASHAVEIWNGTYNGMTNSHVHDVEGGVFIRGGDHETLTPAYNYIENCDVEEFNRFQKTYLEGIHIWGVGLRVSNCWLHGGDHLSLGYIGQYNTLEYNEFSNLARTASDMGAFYCGQYYISRGNRVMYNYIHDIVSPAGETPALYFDDGQSGDYVFGNVMRNITGAGVHFTGCDSTCMNNVFIDCDRSVLMDYRASGNVGLNHYNATDWEKNYNWFDSPLWLEHFPELEGRREEALTEEGFHRNNTISNNVIVNSGAMYLHPNLPKTWGVAENNYTTETDPGFYDADNGNYMLKEDSVVYEKIPDFQPIPFTRMGLYTDRAKNRVKNATVMAIGEPRGMVNGKIAYIDEENDARPFIADNKTFVPLRFVAEALGADVDFDDQTREIKITADGTVLTLGLDGNDASKNGESVTLESAPKNVGGRTYLPLREISELLDREVFWDDSGLIVVSETEELLDSAVDEKIISYLRNEISVY